MSAAPAAGGAPAKPAASGLGSLEPATPSARAQRHEPAVHPQSAVQPRGATGPSSRAPERLHVRLAVAPIRLYERVISPALPRRCKYHPTCSAYAVQAIRSYGTLRGSVLAAWRLLRCNPFSHGGYDPVSAQTLFRSPPRSHSASASHS